MQIEAIVLYHRDGLRSHTLDLWLGRLNVITGASETGKSALIEIVDYCLGSDRHGVYRSRELDTIGWYGLLLRLSGIPTFVARRAPAPDQKVSTDAILVQGQDQPLAPDEMRPSTNIAAVTARLGELIGIEDSETDVPEGSTRKPIHATLRHALAYVFQRQRLIADPEYLFSGQDRPFAAMAIRDTLPYFLGSVRQDALQQRRELRLLRQELARAQRRLVLLTERTDELELRERGMLRQAQDAGLAPVDHSDAEQPRALLAAALERSLDEFGEPAAGEAEVIAGIDARRREASRRLTEARFRRRQLVDRRDFAVRYAGEVHEHRARLLSLELMPGDVDGHACPLCGVDSPNADPTAAELRAELEAARLQADRSRVAEPRLESVIAALDEEVATIRGMLSGLDAEMKAVIARSELARQARSRREVQAFVRGRIAAFLEEHPVHQPGELDEAAKDVSRLTGRVRALELGLSAETTRLRTESTLDDVSVEMTRMARELRLGYTDDGVRLDPVALTVVAGGSDDPVWLNEDIGSGKNWVGYHLVTLLALHKHFVSEHRPVPRLLMLDQPTQAFYPSERRRAHDRSIDELADEDQELVRRQFTLLIDTVRELSGSLQIVVTDHADIAEDWFRPQVRFEWRDGRALVPSDWYE